MLAPHIGPTTHHVTNQPPPLVDVDLWAIDRPLREAVARECGGLARRHLGAFGRTLGDAAVIEQAALANRFVPELKAFDQFGHRVDQVTFHPAYHRLMSLGAEAGMPSAAWSERPAGHVITAAMTYLLTQAEPGVVCPLTMTHAAVPVMRSAPPGLRDAWLARMLAPDYDPRPLPVGDKRAVTIGMAMTEKQGGSDLRANTTGAVPDGDSEWGPAYLLTGHKWFCSAPMSDGFLCLAQAPGGLTCFFIPRWRPDGGRNPFLLQRLKDKLGNRANASAEVEFRDTWAIRVGDEGAGVKTVIEMVHQTRLPTATAPVALMRAALVQALHHCRHRRVFGGRLADRKLMRAVLADLALEVEAGVALSFRIAGAYARADDNPQERDLARIAVSIAKYWHNKRAPAAICEALECLGGNGYVEEGVLARLYREAPLNGIWEGAGNIICLDVLRAIGRNPATTDRLRDEWRPVRGASRELDALLGRIEPVLDRGDVDEGAARCLVEDLALALQASLLLRRAPASVAEAFCRSRLGADRRSNYGTLPADIDVAPILERAWPET